jgi:hypothetical protein
MLTPQQGRAEHPHSGWVDVTEVLSNPVVARENIPPLPQPLSQFVLVGLDNNLKILGHGGPLCAVSQNGQ